LQGRGTAKRWRGFLGQNTEAARQLRRTMTLPEVILWTALRSRPAGFKFRRQHPLVGYVADFYCPAARLAIEVDGIAHEMGDNPSRDALRDKRFSKEIVKTLRIPAVEVLASVEDVVRLIVRECQTRTQSDV
jgi:very-short-patch-repair endonuclease